MPDQPDYRRMEWAVGTESRVSAIVGTARILRVGVDGVYEGRVYAPERWVLPSDYWYDKVIHNTEDITDVAFRTKNVYNHMSFKGKLPNLPSDGQTAWFGFENGPVGGTGVSAFCLRNDAGTIKLQAAFGGSFNLKYSNITSALPSDYDTADHVYTVQTFKNWSEFYIDRKLVAVAFNTYDMNTDVLSYPPYALNYSDVNFTPMLSGSITLRAPDGNLEWELDPTDLRFSQMPLHPSRIWRLYDVNANTFMTEGTYDTGAIHWSQPIPTLGYRDKTFKFRADTDSATGNLKIAWYDQEGHYLYQVEYTYSAGEDYMNKITKDHPMMRLGYEPAADGASITYAEVVLSGEPS